MIRFCDLKETLKYYKESIKTIYRQMPTIKNFEEAEKSLKRDKIVDFIHVKNFIDYREKNFKFPDIVKYGNLYYLGHCGQSDEDEIFQKALNVVEKTFGGKEPILAVYDNGGYKFYYLFHDGLNGTGDFEDYMKEAANKLGEMTNNGATFRTIIDMNNDYVDDVAAWLYVFRV